MNKYILFDKELLHSRDINLNKNKNIFIDTEYYSLLFSNSHNNLYLYENSDYYFFIEGEFFLKNKNLDTNFLSRINDNELVSKYYKKYGLNFIDYFKGTFNLFIISKKTKKLIFINDFLGLFPLYYYKINDGVVFCPDIFFLSEIVNTNEIDFVSIIEYLIFNVLHGDNTWFVDIKKIPAAQILKINKNIKEETYYDINSIDFTENKIKDSQSLSFLENNLKETINNLHRDYDSSVALTGGLDSRTILSCINDFKKTKTFTFGGTDSKDIASATHLSKKININHKVFFIDDDYYKNYFQDANNFIYQTNGTNTFERTHYYTFFKKLSAENKFILTGNAGSELFRTITKGGILISEIALNAISNNKIEINDLYEACKSYNLDDFLNFDSNSLIPDLHKRITANFDIYFNLQKTKTYSTVFRYLFKYIIPNWYGNEMAMSSKYLSNRSPYLDIDFFNACIRTNYISAKQQKGELNPIYRRRGQIPYAYIINKNNKTIFEEITTKGYSPYDILYPWNVFRFINRKKNFIPGEDFNSMQSFNFFKQCLFADKSFSENQSLVKLSKIKDTNVNYGNKRFVSKILNLHSWYKYI